MNTAFESGHIPLAPEHLRARVQEGLGYSGAQLDQNRVGRIAASQIPGLILTICRPFWGSLLATALWVPLYWIFLRPRRLIRTPFGMQFAELHLAITLGCLLTFFTLASRLVIDSVNLLLDVLDGKAAAITGRIRRSRNEAAGEGWGRILGHKGQVYAYALLDFEFPVSEGAYRALEFVERSAFRVYYAPRTRLLLSMEPVASTPGSLNPAEILPESSATA